MDVNDSGRTTPATSVNDADDALRPQSSPPTSPMEPTLTKESRAAEAEVDENRNGGVDLNAPTDAADEEDDTEGMDMKAKALTNLLKTSSVCSASAQSICRCDTDSFN